MRRIPQRPAASLRCQHKRQTEIVKASFQREVKKTRPDKLYLPLAIADRTSEPFLIRGDYYSRILAGTRIPMTLNRIGKKDTDIEYKEVPYMQDWYFTRSTTWLGWHPHDTLERTSRVPLRL